MNAHRSALVVALVLAASTAHAQSVVRRGPVSRVAPLNNPITQVINVSETINLSAAQTDSVAVHNANFVEGRNREWAAFEQYLRALPLNYNPADVAAKMDSTYARVVALLAHEATATKAILTAEQKKALPAPLSTMLEAAADGMPEKR